MTLATQFEALLIRKEYGRAEVDPRRGAPAPLLRRAALDQRGRRRASATRDPEVQALTARLYQIARVTHVVNGVRRPRRRAPAARRSPRARRSRSPHRLRPPRRRTSGAPKATAAPSSDRRLGPRRLRDRGGEVDLDRRRAARPRARRRGVLAIQGRRRARDRRRHDHHRLQHRERHLRPDHLRRAGRDVQGAVGGAPRVHAHRDRRRHRGADAAVRRLPPDSVGVRRRPRDPARQPERGHRARISSKDLLPLPFDARLL